MQEIKTFDFNGSQIRTAIDEEGNPWFVVRDACKILGLDNVGEAVSTLSDEDKKITNRTELVILGLVSPDDLVTTRLMLVTESGLYELIFKSRKDEAKVFKRWITREVLPALR